MRPAPILFGLFALFALGGCHKRTAADKVEHYYDKKAAAMDALAAQQPTKSAQKIYEGRADALRQEGKEREDGLRKAGAGANVPRLSNIEESLPPSAQASSAQGGSVTPPPVNASPQEASPMQAARPTATPR